MHWILIVIGLLKFPDRWRACNHDLGIFKRSLSCSQQSEPVKSPKKGSQGPGAGSQACLKGAGAGASKRNS